MRREAQKQQEGNEAAARGWGGANLAALDPAAPGNEELMVAEGVAAVLCINLAAAFEWMQEQAVQRPFYGSAAGAGVFKASGASSARAGGCSAPAAGEDTAGAGVATGYPKVAQRLRLLLSFALLRVVPHSARTSLGSASSWPCSPACVRVRVGRAVATPR